MHSIHHARTHLERRFPGRLQRSRAQGVERDVVHGPDARVRRVPVLGQVDAMERGRVGVQ